MSVESDEPEKCRLEAEVAHLENQAKIDMVELMRRQNKVEV